MHQAPEYRKRLSDGSASPWLSSIYPTSTLRCIECPPKKVLETFLETFASWRARCPYCSLHPFFFSPLHVPNRPGTLHTHHAALGVPIGLVLPVRGEPYCIGPGAIRFRAFQAIALSGRDCGRTSPFVCVHTYMCLPNFSHEEY